MASSSVWPSPPSAKNENMFCASGWPSLQVANMAAKKERDYTDWSDLPPELTSSILLRLSVTDILENAQKVCRSWRHICKDPWMWRKIDMKNRGDLGNMKYDLEVMCRHAVDRSQGGLNEIALWYFGTDNLLNYIAQRSSNLRSLRLVKCYTITDEGFVEAVVKLPQLEALELSYCNLSHESLKVVGQSCPNMKSLILNCDGYNGYWRRWGSSDDEALAIAETMPRLHHVHLIGNRLSDTGLNAILEKCPNLEYLDLRMCSYISLVGDLEKRCSESIRVVRRPNDSFNSNNTSDEYEGDRYYPRTDIPRYISFPSESEYYDQYDELYDFDLHGSRGVKISQF